MEAKQRGSAGQAQHLPWPGRFTLSPPVAWPAPFGFRGHGAVECTPTTAGVRINVPDPPPRKKIDFLKIEKVELPSFEKGEKQPRKHQEMEDLFPETPQFLPSFACGAGESLLCTQTILDCLFFHSRGLALEALSLAISCRELAIKPFAHHRVFLLPMPIQIRLSICGHDGALRGRLPIERAQEAVVLRFRVVH